MRSRFLTLGAALAAVAASVLAGASPAWAADTGGENTANAQASGGTLSVQAGHTYWTPPVDGFYRRIPVYIRGSRHVPPNPVKVPELMTAWTRSYTQGPGDQHPVVFAAQAHIDLAAIHPFQDGNGRTCRLVVNALLMQSGYPPALYEVAAGREYLSALERAQVDHDPLPFIQVAAAATEEMLDRWFHLVREQAVATFKASQNPSPRKKPNPHQGL